MLFIAPVLLDDLMCHYTIARSLGPPEATNELLGRAGRINVVPLIEVIGEALTWKVFVSRSATIFLQI